MACRGSGVRVPAAPPCARGRTERFGLSSFVDCCDAVRRCRQGRRSWNVCSGNFVRRTVRGGRVVQASWASMSTLGSNLSCDPNPSRNDAFGPESWRWRSLPCCGHLTSPRSVGNDVLRSRHRQEPGCGWPPSRLPAALRTGPTSWWPTRGDVAHRAPVHVRSKGTRHTSEHGRALPVSAGRAPLAL